MNILGWPQHSLTFHFIVTYHLRFKMTVGRRAKHKNTVLKQRLSNFCELLEVKESRISRVSTCNTLAGLELDEFKKVKKWFHSYSAPLGGRCVYPSKDVVTNS